MPPDKFKPYEKGKGQFIRYRDAKMPAETSGGRPKVTLNVQNVPDHTHGPPADNSEYAKMRYLMHGDKMKAMDTPQHGSGVMAYIDKPSTGTVNNRGGAVQGFDIIPPFIGLTLCVLE